MALEIVLSSEIKRNSAFRCDRRASIMYVIVSHCVLSLPPSHYYHCTWVDTFLLLQAFCFVWWDLSLSLHTPHLLLSLSHLPPHLFPVPSPTHTSLSLTTPLSVIPSLYLPPPLTFPPASYLYYHLPSYLYLSPSFWCILTLISIFVVTFDLFWLFCYGDFTRCCCLHVVLFVSFVFVFVGIVTHCIVVVNCSPCTFVDAILIIVLMYIIPCLW